MFSSFQPDVAFLDIGLPVIDGYELAVRVRSADTTCRLVAVTGYGQPGDKARALSAGFDSHLVKPVKLDTLLGVVAAAGQQPQPPSPSE